MRLLQVHNRYTEAGGEDISVDLEREMFDLNGYDVRRVIAHNPDQGVTAALHLATSISNPATTRRLRALVREWRPDIAHVNNTWYRLSPSAVAALTHDDIPVVMTLRNYRLFCVNAGLYRDGRPCDDCLGRGPWRGVVHACYRGSRPASMMAAATIGANRRMHTWGRVDCFIAISEWMRAVAIRGGIPAEKIEVVPNVCRDPGERAAPPSTSTEVIFAGRLDERKGILSLIEAWQANRVALDGLELVLIGQGPLQRELTSKRMSGIKVISWLDHSAFIERLLTARALICPSRWPEPFGRVVVEALSAGLPAIVSDRGGLPELVRPLDPDLVAEADSVSSWRGCLERLADPCWVDQQGQRGRTRFLTEFSLDVGRNRLDTLYRSVLRGGPEGHPA